MSLGFYRAFEEKYRDSRQVIKLRLEVYLPFIEQLIGFYDHPKAIDLGCGRGEWLEILNSLGYEAEGVDLDVDMLVDCHELGLNVHTEEAVSFLKKQSDNSQIVVSGFHIVEHIPFDDLLELVKESLRVLKPGGLLIMETPNPENIVVGSSSFYLDPTHHQPIPPPLLAFLPEYYGYEKVKIIRLQESIELKNAKHSTLLNVLNGVSPDYAVVARKACHDEKILSATNEAFSVDYGLTLESLTQRYDRQAESRVAEVEVKAQLAHVSAQQAEVRAQQAEVRAQQAEVCARESLVMMQQLLSSSSWRITAPLRMIKINILRLYSAIREKRVVSGVKRRIYERYGKSKTIEVPVKYSANYLSPRSTQVLNKLQRAIGSREN